MPPRLRRRRGRARHARLRRPPCCPRSLHRRPRSAACTPAPAALRRLGSAAARLLRALRRRPWRALAAGVVALVGAALVLDALFPFPFERLARPQARLVTDRHGTPLRFLIAADERWRLPVTLAELPPDLPRLVVAAEDRRFGRHPGIDPVALVRATWTNLRAGRVVSGGSTIAMQLARMASPRRRTFGAKAIEALRASS